MKIFFHRSICEQERTDYYHYYYWDCSCPNTSKELGREFFFINRINKYCKIIKTNEQFSVPSG